MRISLSSLLLSGANAFLGGLGGNGDTTETLILWQVLKNGGDMNSQMSMMPLLMTQLFDEKDAAGNTVGVMSDQGKNTLFYFMNKLWPF